MLLGVYNTIEEINILADALEKTNGLLA